MPTNTLTDAQARAIKPSEKATKHFDGGGLYLWVSPSGAKVWRVAYRFEGKPQTMSLGPYPEVSLAEARLKRDMAKTALREGSDPMAPRRAVAEKRGLNLRDANEQYWAGRKDLSDSYRENARRGIEMHLVPKLGERAIGSIGRADLLAELERMDSAGLHVYVRKVRMWAGQVFDWAVERGEAENNPATQIDPRKAFGRTTVEHFAALELTQVGGFLQRLAMERELQSALACKLMAYTWTRTVELRMMLWSEIEDDVWRIPKDRMKRRRDHVVPLSKQALRILEQMQLRSRGSDYVFPADHRVDRPMSENAVLYLVHRMGYKGAMTGHGWRTVASTWANEMGFKPDAIERQLSHAPADKTRSAYNRAEYMPERRAMLQAWADWLDAQERVEVAVTTD